jgi:hypothetical protein
MASLNKMIASLSSKDRHDNTDVRWSFLMENAQKKMDLETARVETTKIGTHAIMIKGVE